MFKVGDKVVIKKDRHRVDFTQGKVYTIDKIENEFYEDEDKVFLYIGDRNAVCSSRFDLHVPKYKKFIEKLASVSFQGKECD